MFTLAQSPLATLPATELVLQTLAPILWWKVVLRLPCFTSAALLPVAVAGQDLLAALAVAHSGFPFPLALRKLGLKLLAVAACAHVRGHMLRLHRFPIDMLPTKDAQQ